MHEPHARDEHGDDHLEVVDEMVEIDAVLNGRIHGNKSPSQHTRTVTVPQAREREQGALPQVSRAVAE